MAASTAPRVLFLCSKNSCRSQMAEGWARALHGGAVEAWSAGIESSVVDPRAVVVMREAGVDIASQASKQVSDLSPELLSSLDVVVTVCSGAHGRCPALFVECPARIVHVGFDDPPRLAAGAASEEEALDHYRRVRDEIRTFVSTLPEFLASQ